MKLRDYQRELVAGIVKEWRGGARRVAAVMATGGGKTVTAMELVRMSVQQGLPVLWIAHRTELIDQAIDTIRQVAPDVRTGRMQGATKEFRADVVVGSVQTCSTRGSLSLLRARRWGLIVVDETHHIVADTYMRILKELGAYVLDGPLTLGITATLDRSDGRALGQVFETIAEPKIGLLRLIKEGFLVPPRGIRVRIAGLDLGKVRRTAGDLNAGQLGAAMSQAMAPQRLVEAWTEHAKGRPTVAFLPTLELSKDVARAFREAGFEAAHLDGSTSDDTRAAMLSRFRAGTVDILCNVGLFTEGTDLPSIACVILGRPTSSGTLYQQMVGRGLRLHPGKTNCVVLDVTGITGKHRLATLASLTGADDPEDIPDELLMYEEDVEEGEDEPREPGAAVAVDYVDGQLEHELIDLFGQSHSSWLRTQGGTWFLPTPTGFLYLRERAPDRYDLRWWTAGGMYGIVREDMEIGYAMAAGDEYVAGIPLWQLERTAPWRSQPGRSGRTRGEEYDAKAIIRANNVLDGETL